MDKLTIKKPSKKKRAKRKSPTTKAGLRYNNISAPKNFPPGYYGCKVVDVIKKKGKAEIEIVMEVRRKIRL